MADKLKTYETIGCCGIDCGLCPRFYTKGDSVCPGCGGLNFKAKHPSCGVLTCCAIKYGLEVCSECKEYPCKRYESEKIEVDSFVTHKKILANHDFIKEQGFDRFLQIQKRRIDILNDLLIHFDDGRTRNFYCISCALLPLEELQEINKFAHHLDKEMELKEKIKRIKDSLLKVADSMQIELKLNKGK